MIEIIYNSARFTMPVVTKAEISLAWSLNGTCQNYLRRMNFVKYLAFSTLSIQLNVFSCCFTREHAQISVLREKNGGLGGPNRQTMVT